MNPTPPPPPNPPAFPSECEGNNIGGYSVTCGMLLRDYFAAKDMQEMLAYQPHSDLEEINPEFIGRRAYDIAEALLRERQRRLP